MLHEEDAQRAHDARTGHGLWLTVEEHVGQSAGRRRQATDVVSVRPDRAAGPSSDGRTVPALRLRLSTIESRVGVLVGFYTGHRYFAGVVQLTPDNVYRMEAAGRLLYRERRHGQRPAEEEHLPQPAPSRGDHQRLRSKRPPRPDDRRRDDGAAAVDGGQHAAGGAGDSVGLFRPDHRARSPPHAWADVP